jgi:myo-inositol-1(or 4)-monophosphatase
MTRDVIVARALDVAIEAAHAGGAVLRDGWGREREVTLKDSRTNIVTWADVNAQSAIVETIRAAFPTHAVVGEEGTVGDAGDDDVWYVDPLDGTTNYAHGLPFFCTSIALVHGLETVCGVVYDPFHDELFSAARTAGATCNGQALHVSSVDRLDRALVVAQAQVDAPDLIREFSDLVDKLMNAARGVRSFGSPALTLCYVAAGRLEAYVERYMDPWDTLAGALMVEEAGGRFSDFGGRSVTALEAADVVGSNGLIHDQLLGTLG